MTYQKSSTKYGWKTFWCPNWCPDGQYYFRCNDVVHIAWLYNAQLWINRKYRTQDNEENKEYMFDLLLVIIHNWYPSSVLEKIHGRSRRNLTLLRPLRRKLRIRWFFDISQVKESSFLIGPHWLLLRFLMRIIWKIPI